MKVNLLGYKSVDFLPKGQAEAIQGTKVFISYADKNTIGLAIKSYWIANKDYATIVNIKLEDFVGKKIDLDVDLNGGLMSICGA